MPIYKAIDTKMISAMKLVAKAKKQGILAVAQAEIQKDARSKN
jgi:hypothetical protein